MDIDPEKGNDAINSREFPCIMGNVTIYSREFPCIMGNVTINSTDSKFHG